MKKLISVSLLALTMLLSACSHINPPPKACACPTQRDTKQIAALKKAQAQNEALVAENSLNMSEAGTGVLASVL